MLVTLLHNTPLPVCSHAVRTCWQSFGKSDNGGPKDRELIDKVGNKFKHSSTLEHLNYNMYIQGISRALLQELARHRIASLSVKSTRYTLKELKDEEPFNCCGANEFADGISSELGTYNSDVVGRAAKYLVWTNDDDVDSASIRALANLRWLIAKGKPNDKAKFALPDAYSTELTWTINARSLQNFLRLRTDTAAMWEMRKLAYAVFDALPEDHKYLFEDCVHP